MMVRLSDRLSQNPVKQQLSSEKQQKKAQANLLAAESSEKMKNKHKVVE